MAIYYNTSASERWDDVRQRLIAEYYDIVSSPNVFEKDLRFHVCDLNVDVDDFSVKIGEKRHLFHHGGPSAEKLCSAVSEGQQVSLIFDFLGSENGPAFTLRNAQGELLAVVEQKGEESLLLPSSLCDEVLSIGLRHLDFISENLSEILSSTIDTFYKNLGYSRSDELVMKFSDYLVSDESDLDPEVLANVLQLIPDDELGRIKERTLESVRDFYRELYEQGEIGSKAEVESGIAYAKNRLDGYFAKESLFFSRLSLEVSSLGKFKGEVQSDDIARVAVWAEKNPECAPYLGKKLEDWVSSESAAYELKHEIVNRKREQLGAKFPKEPLKPRFTDGVRSLAAKRFQPKL